MKYLKVFTDFASAIEPFSDAEKGRLFTAMLEYAATGTEPEFSGNERFIWPTAKLHIDREVASCEKQSANGKKGGRPPKNPTKPNETQRNPNKPTESPKDKDKEYNTTQSIVPIQSIVHSTDDELERLIDGLQLNLFEGEYRHIASAIADAIRTMYNAESIRVNGRTIPRGAVRSVLKSLTIDHIDFIIRQIENQDPGEKVTNGRAYLMACIYNAPADCAVNGRREWN